MLKGFMKKGAALLCAFVLAFGVVGCGGSDDKGDTSYEVWTTYNTMKVIRDVEFDGKKMNDNYVKMAKGINVKMAKNEGEMGSLYVTTGDKGIDKFELIAQELVNENGAKFPVSQMAVYAQRYIKVRFKSRNNQFEEYPLGCYAPDAIVEMDLYKNAGENKIGVKNNQGLTVDFKTTKDTPAGVYTGTFQLVLDSDVIDIPVSVTVWDYTIPDGSSATACVLIYENCIAQGELTTVDSEIKEWYRTYYELALEYKMVPYMVPDSTLGPDKFAENVLKYYNHPNFASFGLPHQTFLPTNPVYSNGYSESAGFFTRSWLTDEENAAKRVRYYGCMDYWYDCIYLLAQEAADPTSEFYGENFFEKCYIYPIDEPNDADSLKIAIEWFRDLEQFRDDVADALVNDGVLDAASPIIASIRDIDIVCTALGDEPALQEFDIVYVPEPYELDDYMIQTTIEKHAEENGNNPLWYYTQIDKTGVGPNAHIDDFMMAGRVLKWMQKYYNLDGWLYWAFNEYLQTIAFTRTIKAIDPYEEISRDAGSSTGAMGDGYFVYPASKYGATEPIKSLRLLTYRDGQEDLDALNYLESLYRDYEDYYGVEEGTFDVNNVLKGLYDRIFCRSTVFRSDEALDYCREGLKDAILNATKEENKFIYTINYEGKNAVYSFYTDTGYTVKVNGQALASTASGSGLKHTYQIDASVNSLLSSVEIVKGGVSKTMNLYELTSTKTIDMTSSAFGVTVSEGSNYTLENGVLNAEMWSNEDEPTFIPNIKFTGIPQTFKVIELDLENTTNKAVEMDLVIRSVGGISVSKSIGLTANTKRKIEVCNGLSEGSQVGSVSIRFKNTLSGGYSQVVGTVQITGIRVK